MRHLAGGMGTLAYFPIFPLKIHPCLSRGPQFVVVLKQPKHGTEQSMHFAGSLILRQTYKGEPLKPCALAPASTPRTSWRRHPTSAATRPRHPLWLWPWHRAAPRETKREGREAHPPKKDRALREASFVTCTLWYVVRAVWSLGILRIDSEIQIQRWMT